MSNDDYTLLCIYKECETTRLNKIKYKNKSQIALKVPPKKLRIDDICDRLSPYEERKKKAVLLYFNQWKNKKT